MLHWIWAAGLILIGMAWSYGSGQLNKIENTIFGVLLQVLGIAIIAEKTVIPAYAWLCHALPNKGDPINNWTSFLLVFALFITVLFFSNAYLYMQGEKNPHS